MRLCTFNVHMWSDASGRSNTGAVLEVLRQLSCDVVALNEVPRRGQQLEKLAHELASDYAFAEAGGLGNALLSRRPLRDVRVVSLGGNSIDPRSALLATVDTDAGPLDLACTHLDPIREPERIDQLEVLHRALAARDAAHVVAGDFNALRLTDYGPAALHAVRRMREQSGWEMPLGDVVACMDAWGYVDCFRFARAGGLDAYARELATPLPDDELPTCWAGTRIDFIWASRAALDVFVPARCWRVETEASDHRPVVVDFALRGEPDR